MKGFYVEYKPLFSKWERVYVLSDSTEELVSNLQIKRPDYNKNFITNVKEVTLDQVPIKELSVVELLKILESSKVNK